MTVVVEEAEQKLAQGGMISLTEPIILCNILVECYIDTTHDMRLYTSCLLEGRQDRGFASLQEVQNQTYPSVGAQSTSQGFVFVSKIVSR